MNQTQDTLIRGISEYEDGFGNRIICGSDNVSIHLRNDSHDNRVQIGSDSIGGELIIHLRGNANDVVIEENCVFPSRSVIMMNGGDLRIADECTFGTGLLIMVSGYSSIAIGKDCMFSYDVNLLAGDGHPIYDLESGEVINLEGINTDECFGGSIEIGEHVWLGLGARVMGGINKTVIGNGSIIGANSLVKGSFPNNAIIAGVPAKIVRKNIAWGRQTCGMGDMKSVCNGYTEFTV